MTDSHEYRPPKCAAAADEPNDRVHSGRAEITGADEFVLQSAFESDTQILHLLQIIKEESKDPLRSDAFSDLLSRYRPLITRMVNKYAKQVYGFEISVADRQELEEEACIALYHAARFYRAGTHATFGYFARVCIRNRLISFLRKQKNEDHLFRIDESLSYRNDGYSTASPSVLTVEDVGEQVAEKDAFRELFDRFLVSLTEYERKVFHMYVKGNSYKEIAVALNVSVKSVDNAVYRIRVKLKQQLQAQ